MRLSSLFLLLLCAGLSRAANERSCTNNAARSWWDVQHYELNLQVDTASGFLSGSVAMLATVTGPAGDSLQIDLQEPLQITGISAMGADKKLLPCTWHKQGNTYYVTGAWNKLVNSSDQILLHITYKGIPVRAKNAPWDGGIILDRDANGKRWMAVACQGAGASIWFPCKDFQGDEADKGMKLAMTIPNGLSVISNGRLDTTQTKTDQDKTIWHWEVTSAINNYDISFYIGDYVHWSDTLMGAKGQLSLDYYVLRNNLGKAKTHFESVKSMLRCFEEKMGAYPFYEDGYKLVEAPYLGMEHQSAVAYGNGYQMGYRGRDRSKTGVGLLFDFIIVHETGHEWFGNSITAYDKADTWIHEGFTTYSETIFAECLLGKEKAFQYQRGKKEIVLNDRPVTGLYNECDEGSGDHYDKAGFMIHMIRLIMDNDPEFFAMLKEMNQLFYHRIVTGREIEEFINTRSKKDLRKVFEQYLRSKDLPVLELHGVSGRMRYRWGHSVDGFNMPVKIIDQQGKPGWIYPTKQWKDYNAAAAFKVAGDFLIYTKTDRE